MLFKTLRKGVLARFIVSAAAMVFAIALQPLLHPSLATPPPSAPDAPRLSIPLPSSPLQNERTRDIVIKLTNAFSFSEGVAAVWIGPQWGYIDKTGKIAIQPLFNDAYEFSDGLAIVKIGTKYGAIDKTGKTVIQPQFDRAYRFSQGLAAVQISNKWGYIDKTGNLVIQPQFDEAYHFSQGLAAV